MTTTTLLVLVVAAAHPDFASAQTPPGAQVFTPPSSIPDDCSQDVTKALYDWIYTLPQGTPAQPTDVQFAQGGCYQVDGMLFLRGLTDFVFDGQGATFVQTKVVNNELTDDLPPNQPAYCGFPNRFVDSSGTVPTGFDIMWFVEGGCDLAFENMNIKGTNVKSRPGGEREQDSAIEVAGAQRVLITNNTINTVWGDFVTVTGLHEANYGGLNFPSFDVTVTDNSCDHSGRQGISMVYANRVTVTGNTIKNVPATAIDLEAEVGGGIEGNILVSHNTFHGYAYLLSAVTYSQLFNFAFTNNTFASTKIVLNSLTKFPGHDFTIGDNDSTLTTDWPNPADVLLTNEATGEVVGNSARLAPPTPYFVRADTGSGLISVADNILNRGLGAGKKFLPAPLEAPNSAVATGCGNESSSGALLDARDVPPSIAQCVTVSPLQPASANLPAFLGGSSTSNDQVNAPDAGSAATDEQLSADTSASANPSDSQPGTVTCSNLSGTVSFNPPLIEGGTSPEVVLAQVALSGCVGADGATTPDSGYGTVSLISPTNDCSSLASGGETMSTPLAVVWSPSNLGTSSVVFPGFSLSSDQGAGINLGGPGTTVSGSYPGEDQGASTTATGYSSASLDDLGAACSSPDGLDSLTISGGTLSLG